MSKVPMTLTGKLALQEEVKNLKEVERPRISKLIAEARAHGDLKENGEYHAARERQAFVEGRIEYIDSLLSMVEVIDVTRIPNTGRVIFGVTVDLVNIDNDDEVTYYIVGEEEANIKLGKISITSPLVRAMVGKREGDVVDVETPTGVVSYEILKVHHRAA